MIKATIIADSVSKHTNQRITTFELEYPRFIHSELLTHREFSRNSASSRAIPIERMIELVEKNTAMPTHWGKNQSGMQAEKELSDSSITICKALWRKAVRNAVDIAYEMKELGLHKQVVNRVLEPFQVIKTLVTATNYDNFFNLRRHKDAQPEIKALADEMYEAYILSEPEVLEYGEWHTPYVEHTRNALTNELQYHIWDNDGNVNYLSKDEAIKVSCSCAAQVSYRRNDTSLEKAINIYDKLANSTPVHASAFEHCATPIPLNAPKRPDGITHVRVNTALCSGNFVNWIQYRQLIPNHYCATYNGENNAYL